MVEGRDSNQKLADVIAQCGWSHNQLASAFVRVALECGARELTAVGRSHVSHWVAGTRPAGRAPEVLRETLSRRLGRVVTFDEIGLSVNSRETLDWRTDTLVALADLGRVDVDRARRQVLSTAAYSVAALALPDTSWWDAMARRGTAPSVPGVRSIGHSDVEAVQDMVSIFSRVDQRRGGGHARTAVVQYLTSDVVPLLRGHFPVETVRRAMFSAASGLAYLSGWMAFDNSEHALAQHYFMTAVKLAAEADDPPMAAHVLRAMAHQALDLGHPRQAFTLADASVGERRYELATPRERALLGVIHARALAADGQHRASAAALLKAENALAAASPGDDEPDRVFFFGEASLAHETACCLRDSGDLVGAEREYRRSVRTRKSAAFTRTHAVTLGYLGAVQARQGSIEEACATWSRALETMDGVRSGRTRQTVQDMRATMSPFRHRGIQAVAELDARTADYLATAA